MSDAKKIIIDEEPLVRRGINISDVALWLSLLGWAALFVFAWPPLLLLLPIGSLLCPVGLFLGLIGLMSGPRKSATWAVALGVLGSLYVPTIWLRLM